jgi:hypothetical protein
MTSRRETETGVKLLLGDLLWQIRRHAETDKLPQSVIRAFDKWDQANNKLENQRHT